MDALRNAMLSRRMATKPGAQGLAAFRTPGPMRLTPGGFVGQAPRADNWMQNSWGGLQAGGSFTPTPPPPRTATIPPGGGPPVISHAPVGGGGGWQPTGQSYTPGPSVPLVGTIPPGGGAPTITHGPAPTGWGAAIGAAGGPAPVAPTGWAGAISGGGPAATAGVHPALAQALAGRAQGGAGAAVNMERRPWNVNRFG